MAATSRYRRSVPVLSLWLTALAVFYLTIGVHLLHPLFHRGHEHSANHGLSYHHSEHHHHASCPLHDYCQTIQHFDLADGASCVSFFSLAAPYAGSVHQQIPQHVNATYPARAPPIA
nr:hypothetical protein [uncultured Desulfuromonas sp.]